MRNNLKFYANMKLLTYRFFFFFTDGSSDLSLIVGNNITDASHDLIISVGNNIMYLFIVH